MFQAARKLIFFLEVAVFVLFLCYIPALKAQFYQGTLMNFGKNRVQYREFQWSFFRFQYYDTYFYPGGEELASFTAQAADVELKDLEKFLEYKLDGRIQFVIFNRLSELRQSNIGIGEEEQVGNVGGYMRINGNKVFLYNSGDHQELRKQIRAGIAQVLINQIMYGGDIKDRLQNVTMLTLPDWYLQGLISYLAEPWNVQLDNIMRDAFLTGRYKKFNRLEGGDAIIAGHSIWYYLAETFGRQTLPNVLYMTKNGRNIENGFLYVYGISFKTLTKNWYEYYSKRYADAEYGHTVQSTLPVLKRPKKNTSYSRLKISPDGKYVAYVVNELGRYKVYLYDLSNKKKKIIMRGGYKTTAHKNDESYPLLAWHPTGKILSIIREHKGEIKLDLYTIDTRQTDESSIFIFDKILDYSYSDDGNSMVMSAVQHGETDIFVFSVRSRSAEQITKDVYDDINPHWINNSSAIIFSSNRPTDTLYAVPKNTLPKSQGYDIFIYDFKHRSFVLKRVTHTPLSNETEPMAYDKENLTYLSDENGIVNRYIAHIDSSITSVDTTIQYRYIVNTYPQTDYARNIISQDMNPKKKKMAEVLFQKGKFSMFVTETPKAVRSSRERLDNTTFRSSYLKSLQEAKTDSLKRTKQNVSNDAETIDTSKVDINNYIFQNEFSGRRKKKPVHQEKAPAKDSLNFGITEQQSFFSLPTKLVYVPTFSVDYFVTQLDNSLIAPSYQLFSGGGGYANPNLGMLIKVGTSDLFEDYKITGGFKVPFDLSSSEYFLSYNFLKKRLDQELVLHRASAVVPVNDVVLGRLQTHEARYSLKWPFSETSSVRGTISYRNDRFVILSTSPITLEAQTGFQNFANLKAEYIYDNTISTGLNLYNGTRLKVFSELYKQVDRSNTTLTVIGTDIRHYERIHRDIIWANRFAASSDFGSQKLIYYLGSVDNPLFIRSNGKFINSYNYNTAIDYTQNYVFQAVAPDLRGFQQNIRNGNNFMVFTSEIRFPVFKYLLNKPIKSEFIKNFQFVPFIDAGTAWAGSSPFQDNIVTTETIEQYPIKVSITRTRAPFVYGYGYGLRSKLFGYFVRADWAWGVEDHVVQPQLFYLTFNLDF